MLSFIKVLNQSFDVIPKGAISPTIVMHVHPPAQAWCRSDIHTVTTVSRLECFFLSRPVKPESIRILPQRMNSKIHFPWHRINSRGRIFKSYNRV